MGYKLWRCILWTIEIIKVYLLIVGNKNRSVATIADRTFSSIWISNTQRHHLLKLSILNSKLHFRLYTGWSNFTPTIWDNVYLSALRLQCSNKIEINLLQNGLDISQYCGKLSQICLKMKQKEHFYIGSTQMLALLHINHPVSFYNHWVQKMHIVSNGITYFIISIETKVHLNRFSSSY